MTKQTLEKKSEIAHAVRPPIVVVMGHIDHGKTTLLDYIRKAKVAEKESGGITQGIGAYQIEVQGKRITFIDTPGHEAFSSMRKRGVRVADIAVLVVSADEGVKPQTEEVLSIIQESELPFVVAVNKIDKPNADPMRVKKELAEKSVLVEGLGGSVPVQDISAKTGEGVDALLETILLMAELEELRWNPDQPGEGVVVESHLDPRRGTTATLLIEEGKVERGDFVLIGGEIIPVRIFENFRGESIERAVAAEPVRIVGFKSAPALGERFTAFASRAEAEKTLGTRELPEAPPGNKTGTSARLLVNIILKADVLGSKEAIEESLATITSPELGNRIVKSEVGDINESDVKLASATKNTFIVGFRVKTPATVREQAERAHVPIVANDVIYELLDEVKTAMLAVAPAEMKRVELGNARILALFKVERSKQVVGGKVESGLIRKGARFDVVRNKLVIGSGRALELQSEKRPVEEVSAEQEFGLLADSAISLAVGDALQFFAEEKVLPQL